MTEPQNELTELTAILEGIAENNLVIATKIEELIEMMLAPSEVDVLEKLQEAGYDPRVDH